MQILYQGLKKKKIMDEQDYKRLVKIIQDATEENTKKIELIKEKYEEKFG